MPWQTDAGTRRPALGHAVESRLRLRNPTYHRTLQQPLPTVVHQLRLPAYRETLHVLRSHEDLARRAPIAYAQPCRFFVDFRAHGKKSGKISNRGPIIKVLHTGDFDTTTVNL